MTNQAANTVNAALLSLTLALMGILSGVIIWFGLEVQKMTTVLPVMEYRLQQLEKKT